jgi:hypothetical protein
MLKDVQSSRREALQNRCEREYDQRTLDRKRGRAEGREVVVVVVVVGV